MEAWRVLSETAVGVAGEADVAVEALPNGIGGKKLPVHRLRNVEVQIGAAFVEAYSKRRGGRLVRDFGNA